MKEFNCNRCNGKILIEEGRILIAGIWFDCYSCENCGNKIMLESKNQGFESIFIKKQLNLHKNQQKLL